jgi:hypothetical protein
MNEVTNTPVNPAAGPIIETRGNLAAGIVGGTGAAIVGAIAWAVITVLTKAQIGFMAIAVGLLVAWAVRTLGKGETQPFAVVGAVLALLGCALGNLLSACAFLADAQSMSLTSVLGRVAGDPALAGSLMSASFDGMDLVFYAIAAYEGYKFARVRRVAVPAQTSS